MITRRTLLGCGLTALGALTAVAQLSTQAPSMTLLLTDGHAPHPYPRPHGRLVLEIATDTLIARAIAHLSLPGRTVIAATSPRTHLLLTFALHDAGARLTEHGSVLIART